MLAIIAVCLSAVSLVLHVIAPRTSTKIDDKAAEVVDQVSKVIPIVAPIVGIADPNAPKSQYTSSVDGFGRTVRDHRKPE